MDESAHGGLVRRRSEGGAKVAFRIIRWAAVRAQEVHGESLAIGLGVPAQTTRRTRCPGGPSLLAKTGISERPCRWGQ
jgi:hypothetical protein